MSCNSGKRASENRVIRCSSAFRYLVAGLTFLVLVSSVRAKDWFYYESTNFELFSEGHKGDARQLVAELELLHQIMSGIVGDRRLVDRRTKVVMFDKERSLADFHPDSIGSDPAAPHVGYHALWLERALRQAWVGPDPREFGDQAQWHARIAEVFDETHVTRAKRSVRDIPTLRSYSLYQEDASMIVLSWEPDVTYVRNRVFRAYAQTMMRSVGISGPPWFLEGMAELMKNKDIELDHYIFGMADPDLVELARYLNYIMPIESLMAIDAAELADKDEGEWLAFAAQSWLLVHYCYFGDVHGPEWRMALLNMLADINRGDRDYPGLLAKHLEITPKELASELFEYSEREHFAGVRQRYPDGWHDFRVDAVKVSAEEMDFLFAELEIRLVGSSKLPEQWQHMAADNKLSPDHRYLWGLHHWLEQDYSAATAIWNELDDDYPRNPLVLRSAAEAFIDEWLREPDFDDQVLPTEVDRYRQLLESALELDPSDQATMTYLAWLEALAETPSVSNVNLIQRSVGGMTHPELTLLAIAVIRMKLGDSSTAQTLVYEYHDRENWPWVELVDALEEWTGLVNRMNSATSP